MRFSVATLLASATFTVAAEEPWLHDETAERGLRFVHDPAVEGDYFIPESIGSGGALLDYDLDGDLDLYLVNGAPRKRADAGTPEAPVNRLFRQEADGRFVDVTEGSGLGDPGYGMGVAVGDVDGDGDPDVYLTNHGPDALYRNRGDGSFEEATAASGLGNPAWSTSAAFFDPDLDGDLDLYVGTYLDFDPRAVCTDPAGRRDYCGPEGFDGPPDALYRNRGPGPDRGTFEDVSAVAGIAAGAPGTGGKTLGVVAEDLDGDGRTDLYAARDGEANALWLNGEAPPGDLSFENRALELGAALDLLGRPEAGMGVAAGDLDGDGRTDLLVTHLRGETNTLYRNLGPAGFADVTDASGLAGPSLPYTGFGVVLADLDHDGDLDAAVANGRIVRGPPSIGGGAPGYWDLYAEPNQLFVHRGEPRFAEARDEAGAFAAAVETGRGLAAGDLDGDGDLDLLVTSAGAPARLYRNDAPGAADAGAWLLVKTWGVGSPEAPDVRVAAAAGGLRVGRTAGRDGSFLVSQDPRAHLGLGSAERVERLTVRWPGRGARAFLDLPARRTVVLAEEPPGGDQR